MDQLNTGTSTEDKRQHFELKLQPGDAEVQVDKTSESHQNASTKKREKFRSKKKNKNKRKLESDGNSEAKSRPPTHFLAVQITNSVIKGAMKAVQDCIVAKENLLENLVVSVDLAHITLGLLFLPDENTVKEANELLQMYRNDVISILNGESMNLQISGIGHFNKRVVFAKISPGGSEKKLRLCSEYLSEKFESMKASNIFSYAPHVTLMKLSKLRSYHLKKKIRSINPNHFENFKDIDFGEQKVETIQLLAMSRKKANKYYFCESDISLGVDEKNSQIEITESKDLAIDEYAKFLSSYAIARGFCDMVENNTCTSTEAGVSENKSQSHI